MTETSTSSLQSGRGVMVAEMGSATHADHHVRRNFENALVVGVLQSLIFHPVDIVRIRYFLNKKDLGNTRSLFNGLAFNCVSTSFKQMSVFPMHDYFNEMTESEFLSGVASGTALGMISTPINCIKVPMQARRSQTSVEDVCNFIYQRYGLLGFARGGMGILTRDVLWSAAYFPLYAYFQTYFSEKDPLQRGLYSSIPAAVVAVSVSYPLDGSRIYMQYHSDDLPRPSFFTGFRHSLTLSHSNLKAYFTAITRTPLAVAFSHGLYTFLQRYEEN